MLGSQKKKKKKKEKALLETTSARPLLCSLFIQPCLFRPISSHESTMEDLEMFWRASERSEAQVPCTQEDIYHSTSKGLFVGPILSRTGMAMPLSLL